MVVSGSRRYKSQDIAGATGLHTGTPITRDELQLAADRLARLGLFKDVQI